jgi:hypothetical protein
MQFKVIKSLSLSEVSARVSEIEGKYGEKIEDIPEDFAEGKTDIQSFEDYVEWFGMVNALRAYREGEDFDYTSEDIMKLEFEGSWFFTPRRIELLDTLSKQRFNSINNLASKIGRNVKNVYNDLKLLEKTGLIRLNKEGGRTSPEILVKEITILFW